MSVEDVDSSERERRRERGGRERGRESLKNTAICKSMDNSLGILEMAFISFTRGPCTHTHTQSVILVHKTRHYTDTCTTDCKISNPNLLVHTRMILMQNQPQPLPSGVEGKGRGRRRGKGRGRRSGTYHGKL